MTALNFLELNKEVATAFSLTQLAEHVPKSGGKDIFFALDTVNVSIGRIILGKTSQNSAFASKSSKTRSIYPQLRLVLFQDLGVVFDMPTAPSFFPFSLQEKPFNNPHRFILFQSIHWAYCYNFNLDSISQKTSKACNNSINIEI